MRRHLGKLLFTGLLAASGLFGVSAACSVSPSVSREYTFADNSCNIPDAIQVTKQVIEGKSHFEAFMGEWDKNVNYLGVPDNKQRAQYDATFTGIVYNLRFFQDRKSTSKLLSSLQPLLPDMYAKYQDESLSFEERTKFAYLYFLNLTVVDALRNMKNSPNYNYEHVYTPKTSDNLGSSTNLIFVQNYLTASNKEYALRRSDYYFFFSRGKSNEVNISRRARSLDDLINYIEHQNRVIVRAPNGRYYGIRKHDDLFRINRDNGSVVDRTFASLNDAIEMLDTCAVNGLVPANKRAICNFGSYGRK